MSKTVRVKVEFEVNVVVDELYSTDANLDKVVEEYTGVGRYIRSIPEKTRHLVLAEQFAIAVTKQALRTADAADEAAAMKGLGNVRAQVISEKK